MKEREREREREREIEREREREDFLNVDLNAETILIFISYYLHWQIYHNTI